MTVDVVRVFRLAQLGAERLPEPVVRAVFSAVADLAWLTRGGGVRQLERNLARIRPDLSPRDLRRVSRQNMRGYMRYYREAFQLPRLTSAQIAARVRPLGLGPLRAEFAAGRSVCAALAHTGNWDLAGAWATKELAPVVTVAEHLEPEELFQGFLDFRTGLGMTIIPFEQDGSVFRELLRHASTSASILPLLADRDLSRGGVEVDLAGHRARVAPGPAALSRASRQALHPAMIRHERLRGARRRAAGSPWGIVIEFGPRLDVPGEKAAVAELTERWVDWVGAELRRYPEAWHMLQKVFVDDLDADRLARAGAHGTGERSAVEADGAATATEAGAPPAGHAPAPEARR
ncbi:phosphatidylinositol mannoside acyltransferase [Georgenia yuyongxinii]|uniref:Phosphatidylinositol mannoside acyltransferase n=1 Tax=Georgenia yuyongxinii TaxID=2589797 RepID=A0A5B8C364_9MICO|nr:phosphatidylinositol mannoside acyltransferase [Georgenia yuyongxinii]QDC24698.1 phosphatidylinositol mannoside acyltransferase [Georgenia yuyongxinii]